MKDQNPKPTPDIPRTYMWKESPDSDVYRIQTNESAVARKLRKRETASQCAWGSGVWIFVTKYARPDVAKKSLATITGREVKSDKKNYGVYYA